MADERATVEAAREAFDRDFEKFNDLNPNGASLADIEAKLREVGLALGSTLDLDQLHLGVVVLRGHVLGRNVQEGRDWSRNRRDDRATQDGDFR